MSLERSSPPLSVAWPRRYGVLGLGIVVISIAMGLGLYRLHRAREFQANAPLVVAAAADLTRAFGELGPAFTRATGQPVRFVFSASGRLADQIKHGAHYDVFAAADAAYVDQTILAQRCAPATRRLYARGHLALFTSGDAVTLADLTSSRIKSIAIADPIRAPYGRAAVESLRHAGVYAAVQQKFVIGENVKAAFELAKLGKADVGLVAAALTFGAPGHATLVDESLHAPLDQAIVECARAGEPHRAAGLQFVDYVTGAAGQSILARYGFSPPTP